MKDISKTKNKIAVFIFFLTLAVLLGLAIKTSIEMMKETQTPKVGGLYIQFENGTTESKVKAILENYNMTVNYTTIDYDSDNMLKRYYVIIDQDKRTDIINELRKDENCSSYSEIKKGNYSLIMLPEEFIPDEELLAMLEKNSLQLKKSLLCYIHLRDESKYWIPDKDAVRIKDELEKNKKILIVIPDYNEG